MPTSYVYINTSGIHNVPLIAEGTSAVPRNYIDGSFNRIDASINQIINDISNNTDSFWSGDQKDISYNGNVGVGRKQPREQLDISGAIILSSSKSTSDASNGTIMFSDASGFLGRKNNIWVPLDNSGSGGGGGPSFDASFNYYFMDAPLAPTDGSSVLVTGAITTQFVWQFISSGSPGI
jgi:hypothetical protein